MHYIVGDGAFDVPSQNKSYIYFETGGETPPLRFGERDVIGV